MRKILFVAGEASGDLHAAGVAAALQRLRPELGLAGVGGGILVVPLLALGFGISQRIAQGTSLLAILPTAAIGALTYYRSGEVDLRAAVWMAGAGIPAALVGAGLALWLPQRFLVGAFGTFLLFAAFRTWPRKADDPDPISSAGRSGGTGSRKE